MRDVSFFTTRNIFFCLLLLASLGWKALVQVREKQDVAPTTTNENIGAFLARQHFKVFVSDKAEDGDVAVRAVAGTCRILVVPAVAEGFHSNLIQKQAASDEVVFVVFGGKIYKDQPTWLTVGRSILGKVVGQLGFRTDASRALFVIASRGCEADRLPWAELK